MMTTQGGQTILLFEPDHASAAATAERLTSFGYAVQCASTEDEAYAAMQQTNGPDLILMDVNPGGTIDGSAAASRLLGMRRVPVVFTYSSGSETAAATARGLHPYGLIPKHCDAIVLRTSIAMAFELFDAQRTARESEERMRAIIEGTPHLFFYMQDEDANTTYVSPTVESVTGYSVETWLKRKDWFITNAPINQVAIDKTRMHLRGEFDGKPILVECRHATGATIVLEAYEYPIIKNGRVTGLQGVAHDMTEKQKLVDSMLRAQKLESLGILAGGIAHDFNNMLAGIFGYLEIARRHASKNRVDQTGTYLDKALGVFDRTRALTQQLLTFAKGGTPVRRTLQIEPLIRHSAAFALSGSNVSSHCNFAGGLWACNCDENQIGQVIDNIVINAKQAMPNGGTIHLSAGNAPSHPTHPGRFVCISIRDEGIGMSADVREKIFDPFFSTKASGHGLGLATVFSIIQRHDGWIDVESQPGVGTTFHVYIPASDESGEAETVPTQALHAGSGTILVMDDEDFMLDIVSLTLGDMGYTVETAKNGDEALRLFTARADSGTPFTASILDLTIPGGVGGEVIAREFQAIDPRAIIIASSGYAENAIVAHPTDHGFADSIVKPYRRKELTELMKRVLPVSADLP